MEKRHRRMLEQHAKEHDVKFMDAEGVTDDASCEVAMMAICIASQTMIDEGTPWAMTGDVSGKIVVAVARNA